MPGKSHRQSRPLAAETPATLEVNNGNAFLLHHRIICISAGGLSKGTQKSGKPQLKQLAACVKKLQELTERVCNEKIESF